MGIRLLSCNPIPPSQGCWARWFVSVFLIPKFRTKIRLKDTRPPTRDRTFDVAL
jgi:hypothetical protein